MTPVPEVPDAPSLPVLIVSGLGAPRASAQVYGAVFRSRGFRVYTSPQRLLGYGDVRAAARIVGETIEDVRQRTGASQVKLVGMSLGGLIGLVHLKCGGDPTAIERFISVGGPLNGASAARLMEHMPGSRAHAVAQANPDSDLMRDLRAAPTPENVRLISVGTAGDVMTPRSAWDAEGFEVIETPYGRFPVGHWMLFVHPGNHRIVADLLGSP